MVRRGFIVTRSFDDTQIVGYLEINDVYSDTLLAQCVLAPAYKQNEDGTIELLEFSLIPAPDARGLIERGMEKANEA